MAVVAAALCAAATAGCGFGEGSSSEGEATLTVTRDYGAERLLEASVEDPPSSDTVMRFLDREAEIETRYGGGFVQSIDGLSGSQEEGRSFDWFFYVNGIESPVGAAEFDVRVGDRVWWDYRDWTAAMRVPAVIGSWPEPFLHGFQGERYPIRIECLVDEVEGQCLDVAERLEESAGEAGVKAPVTQVGQTPRPDGGQEDALRLLVGTWDEVLEDEAAAQIEDGPATSGVFADIESEAGGYVLVLLDERGEEVQRFHAGAGLVAAVRRGEDPPTWVVTGTDEAGVELAVQQLDDDVLRDRYAVAATQGRGAVSLPVVGVER
jgi:hypothetical protein